MAIDVDNNDNGIILRKFIGLALLPLEDMEEAFRWLLNSMTPEIYKIFEDLAKYFYATFVKRPYTFSLYDAIKTFEDVGDIHVQVLLNKLKSDAQPSIWDFMREYIKKC